VVLTDVAFADAAALAALAAGDEAELEITAVVRVVEEALVATDVALAFVVVAVVVVLATVVLGALVYILYENGPPHSWVASPEHATEHEDGGWTVPMLMFPQMQTFRFTPLNFQPTAF
jgi:hypothetical protein